MSFSVKYSEDIDSIIITINEDMTRKLAIEIGDKIFETIKQHETNKLLFDLRNSRNTESAVTNYDFAYKEEDDKILFKKATAALLTAKGDKSHDFLQLFMYNAGYNVKIFHDEDSAIAWLNEEA